MSSDNMEEVIKIDHKPKVVLEEEEVKLVEKVKLEEKEVKPEIMDRESKGCMKCPKTAVSICSFCIGCWRFCLNSCEVVMECNIRCCTCAKGCLERIDCDETP